MPAEKIVVTGLGAVTPLGLDVASTWEALCAGRSGAAPITKFDVSAFPVRFGAEVKGFDPTLYMDRKLVRRFDSYMHFAYAAAAEAFKSAGLDKEKIQALGADRCGTIIGSGIGGMQAHFEESDAYIKGGYKKVSPFFIPAMIPNMASGMLAIEYGLKGLNFAVSSACATSNHAIFSALRSLRAGDADLIICGGSEVGVNVMSLAGFIAEKALSTRNDAPEKASRPFDKDRDGFVLGEGSTLLILETESFAKKRGAKILAEIAGAGASCDAYHMTAPSPDGSGAARSMLAALKDAGIEPHEVDYVNAHGTSTPLGDRGEVQAVKSVLGEHASKVKMNSTKSMSGHLLGAAGGLEAIVCIQSIINSFIHPTINLENPDEGLDLDFVPNVGRECTVNCALSNSFGFGGHNSSVVIRKYSA
jgi:3-oxoacyl-[acyl-carrier-protein] synthase II